VLCFWPISCFYDIASKLEILHFPFVIFFAAHDVVEDELRNDPAGTDGGMQVAFKPHLPINSLYCHLVD
jgi:hypothetical protein